MAEGGDNFTGEALSHYYRAARLAEEAALSSGDTSGAGAGAGDTPSAGADAVYREIQWRALNNAGVLLQVP